MFTGLIEDVGALVSRRPAGNAAKLEVKTKLPLPEIRIGDSIAVNGACLTVEKLDAGSGILIFHTLVETLARTNLAQKTSGDLLNLERALRLGDRLGGHLVQGHVDSVAAIRNIQQTANDFVLTVTLPDALKALLIPKGSIAIDGISLTVAGLQSDSFSVHIIPHTWRQTNLSGAKAGDAVNLEADMIGKYLLRQRSLQSDGMTMTDLEQAGFV